MPGYWFCSFVAFLSTATSSLSVETQKQKERKKEDLGDIQPSQLTSHWSIMHICYKFLHLAMGDIDLEKHKKYRSFSCFDVVFERAVLEINRFIITPISHKYYLFLNFPCVDFWDNRS